MHRFVDNRQDVLRELCQIDLLLQRHLQFLQRPESIILVPVEALIDDPLDSSAQWLEQYSGSQRAGNDDKA